MSGGSLPTGPPTVVISLDFELRWGLHDVLGADREAYRAELEGAREVVPKLLDLFTDRAIPVTWACVGALACEGWDEYVARAPEAPKYANTGLTFDLHWMELDPRGDLHFAPDLLASIARTEYQELASHTFSHIFLGERGVVERDVRLDAVATRVLFESRFGVRPVSIVFPRNQVGFLHVLAEEGIRVARTNPLTWYWSRTLSEHEILPFRLMRAIDSLLPFSHRSAPLRSDPSSGVVQTVGSIFLRLNASEAVFRASKKRVAVEAARLRPGSVLHLWCHPHNLGRIPRTGVDRLAAILDAIVTAAPAEVAFRSMAQLT